MLLVKDLIRSQIVDWDPRRVLFAAVMPRSCELVRWGRFERSRHDERE